MRFAELIPHLQIAVGPVILISGVGLLLLSMTNRLGRTIDRARILIESRIHRRRSADRRQDAQLSMLWRRAQMLRTAITLASISALLASVLIIVLFVGEVLQLEIAFVVIAAFIGCLAALIASLVYFIRDVDLALHALGMEMAEGIPDN